MVSQLYLCKFAMGMLKKLWLSKATNNVLVKSCCKSHALKYRQIFSTFKAEREIHSE